MAMVEVKRDFKVLGEGISPENVQVMAELITIKQTKCLIGYIGENAIKAHDQVYYDVVRKEILFGNVQMLERQKRFYGNFG